MEINSSACFENCKVVVIATYNEASNISTLIKEIIAQGPDIGIVIVDDGSPDQTASIARIAADEFAPERVLVINRGAKLGYGSAHVLGIQTAYERGATAVVTMDADFSHNPHEIKLLTDGLAGLDVVIGSRYINGIRILNWPFRRLLLSCFANYYVKTILGFRSCDCTSGFRAYSRHALEKIDFSQTTSQGYSFLVEILFLAQQQGLKVGEVPIVFTERREGCSKMSTRVIGEAIIRPWKLRLASLLKRESQKATDIKY